MADWDYAVEDALYTGHGFRRTEMPVRTYLTAHYVDDLISMSDLEDVTAYSPTPEDLVATNWRRA